MIDNKNIYNKDFIDDTRALQDLTSDKNKEILLERIDYLSNLLQKKDYDLILIYGTLLGAIRNNDFIAGDNDIDIGIILKTNNIVEFENLMLYLNQYDCKITKKYTGSTGHYHIKIIDRVMDVWLIWEENRKLFISDSILGDLDIDNLFPLKTLKIKKYDFKIPNKTENLFKFWYGDNWKIPDKNKSPILKPNSFLKRIIDKRQKEKDLLWELSELFNKNNITFWLEFGTLLGAVRENNFIIHDPIDIDLGLYYKDYWKIRKILENTEWKYKYIWARELAIYKNKEELPLHIDLFFIEKSEKDVYLYMYRPNNRDGGKWTKEWRYITPKKLYFPLNTIKFLDKEFKVPSKPEKYLEHHYGTWQVPRKGYTTYDSTIHKDNYNMIDRVTAIVPSFLRDDCLKKLITSIRQYYPTLKTIIGYQGKKIDVDDKYTKIIYLPKDCGLSFSRNKLVEKVNTEFTLLLDDDFIFCEATYIEKMLEVFIANEDIGIVGGRLKEKDMIKSYEKYFIFANDIISSIKWDLLYQNKVIEYNKINYTDFGLVDIIFNFFIAKTEILKKYSWDNRHKIHSEHLDFFINLKLNSDIKVAFVPDIYVIHSPNSNKEFSNYRKRMFYDLIYKKYGYKYGHTIGESGVVVYEKNKKDSFK